MKGLELSRKYYEELCRPELIKSFEDRIDKIAFGLVGDGSECYGFDDELSQDHDFGPRVLLWLTQEDYAAFGAALQEAVSKLPKSFMGYEGVNTSMYGEGRDGVFTIPWFYARFIGLTSPPETIDAWRRIPEVNLSIATNGEVFSDCPGVFTEFRNALKAGYPEDLRLKKMAARCMKMAQAGQYNYERSVRRKEFVAARMAAAEFTDAACSMIYLMNNRYKPFYKWMHRGLQQLPILGEQAFALLHTLSTSDSPFVCAQSIETLSASIIEQLRKSGLTDSTSDFLLDHGPQIQKRIKDERLRNMVPWSE
jgi:hypothetical protein